MEAVKFQDSRKRETVSLPSVPGSAVTVVKELNVGQQRRIMNSGTDTFGRGIATLVESVESWNLAGEDGQLLQISTETFERFLEADLMALFAAVTGKTVEELKDAGAQELKKNQALSFGQ